MIQMTSVFAIWCSEW